ncbi:hypothetical protein BH24ACT19_BH24ACT19_18750 [soil metagenome]|jgi:hypothetical protein
MDRIPRDALSSLDLLHQSLDGAFAARADGLLAFGFALLDCNGREFGRLRLAAAAPSAELRLGDHAVELEVSGRRLRMVADGEEVLIGTPKAHSIDELVLSSGDRAYDARFSFFRNRATASRPGGEESARLSGGTTGRSYGAIFDAGDACALPVAVFILWHLTTNRRRAYLAGTPSKGGKM